MSYGILGGLGRACYRHRWITLLAWIGGLACLIVLWVNFGAAADNSFTSDPGQTLLNQHFPRQSGDTLTLAIRSDGPVTGQATEARVRDALAPFRAAAHVTNVTDPYTTPGHVSSSGRIAFATVQFDEQGASIPTGEAKSLMADATAASGHGLTFSLGGDVVDTVDTPYGGSSDGIGVGAAMVVLLVAFGSLLAMGLPVACALFGIGTGLALTALIGHVFPAPGFSPIIASMIGLGVGVDYALFIVTRFRAELRKGLADELTPQARRAVAEAAAVTAMRTAGRSVLIAGATVVIGMLGLLVLRQQLLNGTAIAASTTVAMTVLAALTLLPALLGFSGTRLAKPSRFRLRRRAGAGTAPGRSEKTHPAERWAGVIQRHPVTAAVTSAIVVLALAAPILVMKLSMPDDSTQPRSSMGYASYATMAQGFGPGFDAPLIVAASPATAADRIVTALRSVPGVASVTPPVISADHAAAMIIAYPTTGEQDPATNALVNTISSVTLPRATSGTGTHVYLTGPNAGNVAFANLMGQRLPWLIAVVVALSMLLILTMFRSVVIALKAALMNLLSITAAYGVLTAVTQWGWGGKLFGFPEPMPVTTWVPVFLFVILFGLSMDYEVFLLSRVREAWLESGSNSFAVARGLALTARVISAAAAIMVVVFLGFVATPDVSVKQIGLGLAVAVLIDATIVRLVLVPALMELLGRANWWMPSWLARVLPGRQDSPREDEPLAAGAASAAGG
jgi:uncharacterized membrane protein YdfJ with MMPL/SSD domain